MISPLKLCSLPVCHGSAVGSSAELSTASASPTRSVYRPSRYIYAQISRNRPENVLQKKTNPTRLDGVYFMAEKEGFEPSIPFWGIHDFQSCALGQLRDFSKCAVRSAKLYYFISGDLSSPNLYFSTKRSSGKQLTRASIFVIISWLSKVYPLV